MKYIIIHKSKFIKFFIVILVCVFGFFGVNIMVNADSVWPFGDVNIDTGDYPGNYMMESHFNWDSFNAQSELAGFEFIAGGNDTLAWFGDDYESTTITDYWRFKNSNIYDNSSIDIPRTIVLNKQKSNDNLLCYDCIIELGAADWFIFEKNDFFMRLNDLYTSYVPSVKFPINAKVGMEIHGFILDKDGNTRELYLVSPDKYVTHNSQFYLYPTKSELFGNIDFDEVYSSNAIMYISNYRCMIEFYGDNIYDMRSFNYYYSVQSVNDDEMRYGTILTDYVNAVSSSDIVGGVADNVNSFLQIEILPGLSFFGILLLAIAVPMLIWILKIFFGG